MDYLHQAFVDSLATAVLHPPARPNRAATGLRIIPAGSTDRPKAGVSIRFEELDQSSLPEIPTAELPLSLDDPRRVYASGIAGVRLTHPGGAIVGGPASEPEFAQEFLVQHGITLPQELQKATKSALNNQLDSLRDAMRKRAMARTHNLQISNKIEELVSQRKMERRVHEMSRT